MSQVQVAAQASVPKYQIVTADTKFKGTRGCAVLPKGRMCTSAQGLVCTHAHRCRHTHSLAYVLRRLMHTHSQAHAHTQAPEHVCTQVSAHIHR